MIITLVQAHTSAVVLNPFSSLLSLLSVYVLQQTTTKPRGNPTKPA